MVADVVAEWLWLLLLFGYKCSPSADDDDDDYDDDDDDDNNTIIIIALKGEIEIFTISSMRRELSPTRTLKWSGRNHVQITCNTSSVYHAKHAVCHFWYVGIVQLLSLTELKSHLFNLYFIYV